MVRSALLACVSNHEGDTCLILRDAAKRPLLRMRFESGDRKIEEGDRQPSTLMVRRRPCAVSNHEATDGPSSFETRRRRRSSG
jgi:hypothetical protein